jgi:hypothetical protein
VPVDIIIQIGRNRGLVGFGGQVLTTSDKGWEGPIFLGERVEGGVRLFKTWEKEHFEKNSVKRSSLTTFGATKAQKHLKNTPKAAI